MVGITCLFVILFANGAAFAQQSPAPDFIPDYLFQGSQLTAWQAMGQAKWTAENGVISATTDAGGGWLMFDNAYEDAAVFTRFRCTGPCDAGVLFRAEKTQDGMNGIFVSLKSNDVAPYRVALDSEGHIVKRELARPPNADGSSSSSDKIKLASDEWNSIEIFVRANEIQNTLNGVRRAIPGGYAQPPTPEALEGGVFSQRETMKQGYGPVALYVGSGKVAFADLAIKDLIQTSIEPEQSSDRFRVQRVADFYYAWGTDAADLNRDGQADLVAGPYYYLGPDFLTRREFYPSQTMNPGVEFVQNMLTFAEDWTGDGWPDVLLSEMRPLALYVNPQGESRRWDRVDALPDVCSEIAIRGDVDSDGLPEIVYVGSDGRLAYGEPDPANPLAPWRVRKVSESMVNGCSIHSVGIGDVNGDGRMDILQVTGWWEQPAANPAETPWVYHEAVFGRAPSSGGGGGAISVSDFNGDGLNDVVASLNAHGWGLAWFEQQRDASGKRTFVKHTLMEDFSTKNAGDVTFSQPHAGAIVADVDRDGVMDFIVGKRHWAHLDTLLDPDADGEAVIYWYRTVRDADAPGGARFEPELIHNKSGVGSEVKAMDVNQDGAVDILASGTRGTFVFWGIPDGQN